MKLIFINFIGCNYLGVNIYEFLFANGDLTEVIGDDWDSYPANGNPRPPLDYINAAYKVETDLNLELIQNHDSFDMYDCKHGVIALAWEEDKDFEYNANDVRLFFSFGESEETVENKLYERDIHLQKIFNNEKKGVN